MKDSDLLLLFLISALLNVVLVLILVSYPYRINSEMEKALKYLNTHIIDGSGSPVTVLAMIANALQVSDRQRAILLLVNLATLHDNAAAFACLREHIGEKALKDALNRNGDAGLKACYAGGSIGKLNAKKLICFAIGTRGKKYLGSDLAESETDRLFERFGLI